MLLYLLSILLIMSVAPTSLLPSDQAPEVESPASNGDLLNIEEEEEEDDDDDMEYEPTTDDDGDYHGVFNSRIYLCARSNVF